ncbi:MAG: hypothetical protein GX777_01405, partial [Fastidiosipila sp.]|nr:hypothetical protein [Fastidiosipila sp.]
MIRKKISGIFKKEDGAGLVLALMVLMVLAVLGVAVAGVTVGSHKLGNISRDSNSAYYIAEAGANLAYEGIKNGVMPVYTSSSNDEAIFFTNIAGLIADFNPKEYAEETFETQFGDQPKATITISDPKEKDGGKLYTITSIGEVDGKSRKVEKEFLVKFVPTTYDEEGGEWDFSGIPVNTAAVVKNKVNLIDGNIKGDVRFSSLKAKTFVFSSSGNLSVNNVYTTYSGELKDIFDMPQWMLSNPPYDNVFQDDQNTSWETYSSILSIIELPLGWQDYPLSGDIIISGSQENVTKKDHSFRVGTISITGSASLVIDNSVRDINIIVDHFTLEGDTKNPRFEFTGDRQVNLFVRDSLKLGSACHLNRNGVTSQFRLFYMGNKNIPHPGTGNLNAMINGSLIVKEV